MKVAFLNAAYAKQQRYATKAEFNAKFIHNLGNAILDDYLLSLERENQT